MKNKKTTIKPKKDYNFFQYAAKFGLSRDNNVGGLGRIFYKEYFMIFYN